LAEICGVTLAIFFIFGYIKNYFRMLEMYQLNHLLHHTFLGLFCYSALILASVAYLWHLFTRLVRKSQEAIYHDIQVSVGTSYLTMVTIGHSQ